VVGEHIAPRISKSAFSTQTHQHECSTSVHIASSTRNDDVTVFKAIKSHEVIGCKIKNVEKKQVKDQPAVAVLMAESLMRHAQAGRQTSGYGKIIGRLEKQLAKGSYPNRWQIRLN